jgi:uncharacterized membrane protein (DUF4010 family)
MDTIDIFQRLAVALAIGTLIGVERGWRGRTEGEGERTAGLRTHALLGLLGGVWGALVSGSGPGGLIALAIAFTVVAAAITVFRLREVTKQGTFGATTLIAGLLAFSLGSFAVLGSMPAAAAAGVGATGLLALKGALHGWLQRLTWEELRASLLLLAMSVILLPILPDRGIGPYAALNPRQLWTMTIMLAAVAFAGYIAIRVAGERRGIALTGIAGGLVSSTAVTVTLSRLARENPVLSRACLSGMAFSSGTMVLRVLAIVALLNATMLTLLWAPLLVASLTLWASGAFFIGREPAGEDSHSTFEPGNPFELSTVLQLGALLAVITLSAKVLAATVGPNGLLALAAVSGIADVDAITLSMTELGRASLGPATASLAILVAVAVNTVTKVIYAWIGGGRPIGIRFALISILAVFAGVAAFYLGPGLWPSSPGL